MLSAWILTMPGAAALGGAAWGISDLFSANPNVGAIVICCCSASRSRTTPRTAPGEWAGYALAGVCGLICVGAIVVGIYAMAEKPSSKKPAKKTAAVLIAPGFRSSS
jgi:hypothetical protein